MKMKVPDAHAIYSLIKRGARHRMVITWWHLQDLKRVEVTPGHDHARLDKNALAIEIFAQYMAQLETLEMTYFALRDKARDPSRSFLEHLEGIRISEHFAEEPPPETSYSGERILVELEGMDVGRFQRELGLPSYEETVAAACGKPFRVQRTSKADFEAGILETIQWLRDAVANKRERAGHKAFMKVKHGGIMLTDSEDQDVYLVQDTYPLEANACIAEVLPFDTSEKVASLLADETAKIGWLVIRLMGLYLGHSPFDACEGCKSCDERPEAEPTPSEFLDWRHGG